MAGIPDTFRYYLFARHKYGHGVHSPFAYRFIREVLRDKTTYPEYGLVEKIRKDLLRNKTTFRKKDLGTGAGMSGKTVMGTMVRRSSVSRKFGRLLFRIARFCKPERILELGSAAGISTAYLALGNPEAEIISLEGDPVLCRTARNTLQRTGLKNVQVVEGAFKETLPELLTDNRKFDLLFIDGDHRGEALMSYCRQLIPSVAGGGCIILDDIHWSEDMVAGWNKVRTFSGVTLSLDLLQMGILFLDPKLTREQMTIRF